jgi:DNA-binding IclR family transcriptional regulator
MKLTTVEKSIKIIELLADNSQSLSLSEMTNMVGFSKSTIHHILNTLLPYDYIAKDPETKRYSLGFKFLEISR